MTTSHDEISQFVQKNLQLELGIESVPLKTNFLEMGIESLTLIKLRNNIKSQYGVDISIGKLFRGLSTVEEVVDFLAKSAKPKAAAEPQPAVQAEPQQVVQPAPQPVSMPTAKAAPAVGAVTSAKTGVSVEASQQIMSAQLSAMQQLFQQQLDVLQRLDPKMSQPAAVQAAPAEAPAVATEHNSPQSPAASAEAPKTAVAPQSPSAPVLAKPQAAKFTYKPDAGTTSAGHNAQTEQFIEAFNHKTAGTKAIIQQHRKVLCDNRNSIMFSSHLKEMTYPIIGKSAKGAHFTDVDGNRFIDIAMGFGVNLFGHNPDFVQKALRNSVDEGFHLGPVDYSGIEVAELISDIAGVERVAFSNSGTEAIMLACRAARAATGKNKIVIFNNSYHGHYTEMLFVSGIKSGEIFAQSNGIPDSLGQNLVVLNYGEQQSLDYIAAHSDEIAMVMVEPVQSRNINLRPKAFIQNLRQLTRQKQVVLLFDEIITGFRYHQQGAQHYYQVKADLVTYGKVIGGGLPIGVLAGTPAVMDYIDGGYWQFGDDSFPEKETTFFAGTFCKHPLAMNAAKATLLEIQQRGPQLQSDLNSKTDQFVGRLNQLFDATDSGIEVANFGSLFKFNQKKNNELFFPKLLMNGVYTWEGRTCFLSTEHDEAVLDKCFEAFEKNLVETSAEAVTVTAAQATTPQVIEQTTVEAEPVLQNRLALISKHNPEASKSYNEFIQCIFTAGLEVAKLEKALERLFERHSQLQQVFSEADLTAQKGCFTSRDAIKPHSSVLTTPQKFADWRHACVDQEFDLTNGPLFRVHLARVDLSHEAWADTPLGQSHGAYGSVDMVFFITHHTIMDGLSLQLLSKEMVTFYEQPQAQLPEAQQYHDYLASLHNFKKSPEFIHQKNFWNRYLSGWQSDLANLPESNKLGNFSSKDETGGIYLEKLDGDLAEGIIAYARANHMTPYMLMFSIYSLYLSSLLKQSKYVMSTSVSGRNFDSFESLVGLTTTMLPIRVDADQLNQSFTDYLGNAAAELLDIMSNQDLTIDDLTLSDSGLENQGMRPALLNRYLNYDFNFEAIKLKLNDSGTWSVLLDNPKRFTFGELSLDVIHTEDDMFLQWEYAGHTYAQSEVRDISTNMMYLLRHVVEASQPLTLKDIKQLLDGMAAPSIAIGDIRKQYRYDKPVHELFEQSAEQSPQACAIIDRINGNLAYSRSFAELNAQANAVAHHLLAKGLKCEDPVFVSLRRGLPLAISVLAVFKAGGIYVPIDKKLPEARVKSLMEVLKPRFAITDGDYAEAISAEDVSDGSVKSMLQALEISLSFDFYREVALLTDCGISDSDDTRLENPGKPFDATQVAYITCTSGSTSTPNCVMTSHGAIAHHCLMMKDYMQMSAEDCMIQFTDLCWDIVLEELFPVWSTGGKVLFIGDTPPNTFADFNHILVEHNVTLADLPSTYWQGWVEELESQIIKYPQNMRRLLVGTEKVDLETLKKWQKLVPDHVIFSNAYAQTETTITATESVISNKTPITRSVPLGKPLANTGFYVLDEEAQPVPVGEPGELYIGGPLVSNGYYGNEELTAAKYVVDPFIPAEATVHQTPMMYKTGDMVRMDQDNCLEFIGRTDFQIKVRGHRIEPSQLESAIGQIAGIDQVVLTTNTVIDKRVTVAETKLICYVKTALDETEQFHLSEQIRHLMTENFAHYMQPHIIMYLDDFPKTSNGKVALRQFPLPGDEKSTAAKPAMGQNVPAPSQDNAVLALIRKLLYIDNIDTSKSFLALGGDSLIAIKLISRLQQEHGITVKLAQFMKARSVDQIIGLAAICNTDTTALTVKPVPAVAKPSADQGAASGAKPKLAARKPKKVKGTA